MLAAVTTDGTRDPAAALNARLHSPGRVPMLDAQGFPIPGRYQSPRSAANTAAYRGYKGIPTVASGRETREAARSAARAASWARRLEREYRESGSAMLWAVTTAVAAETVLAEAVDAYRAALGDRLVAAYALGSLAHGGFSPLVSDIDLGLIVADPIRDSDLDTIQAVADGEKGKRAQLSERLSVFWGTPSTLRGERVGGRFPALDRLDLLENGRLLAGTEARAGLSRPGTDELLITGADFALDFLAGVRGRRHPAAEGLGSLRPAGADAVEEIRAPELLLRHGVRRLTKLVLFPVRFLFTAATGRVGTNADAVAFYLAGGAAPATTLVAAALAWRAAPPPDERAAIELLREQLVPLYLHYIDDHITRLDSLGKNELARAFEEWRARLVR
jgi:predicted nucleotidyltransferase